MLDTSAWFQKAADQDLVAAPVKMGDAYTHGRGVPKNDVMARNWYLKAEQSLGTAPILIPDGAPPIVLPENS